ncbi:DUF523 domain-containing protein [Kitasatospora sp. NPDC056138]|uniref:DUF523 domain-containing protein n=1 Tax=Kitasatospora sp. NPDC056138 TaxID=3345724 RepID=UPI0035DD1570
MLLSACLSGRPCRYDGSAKESAFATETSMGNRVVPFCPETAAGMATPRRPAEIVGGDGGDVLDGHARVVDDQGTDVTDEFVDGAHRALAAARRNGCTGAVLTARSPSCGCGEIYDGSFDGVLRLGDGVTAALLRRHGINVRTAL